MKTHYAERDIVKQGAYYTKHVSAMTGEALHSKSAIAAELAHRDIEIDRLWRELGECAAGWDTGKLALAENAVLRTYVSEVEAWFAEGEKVFANTHSFGFTVGVWWGRRKVKK